MLIDCADPVGSELFIVEGRNAANALKRVRSSSTQAILALQGKLPNASRTKPEKILNNKHVKELLIAIGARANKFKFENLPYGKVIILTDPDADGVHARALVMIFFYCYLRPLVEQGALYAVYPPLYCVTAPELSEPKYAYTVESYQKAIATLQAAGVHDPEVYRYKGIASLDTDLLSQVCVKPESRTIDQLTEADCATMFRAFGGAANS